MKETSDLTTIILALIVGLPAILSAIFAGLALRQGRQNAVAVQEVKTEQAKIMQSFK